MPTSSRSRPGMICCCPWVKVRGFLPLLVSRTFPPSSFKVYSMLTLDPFSTARSVVAVCAIAAGAKRSTRAAASLPVRFIVTSRRAHEQRRRAISRLYTRPPGASNATGLRGGHAMIPGTCESLLRLVPAGRRPVLPRGAGAVRRRERDSRGLPPAPAVPPGRPAVALLSRRHLPGGGATG